MAILGGGAVSYERGTPVPDTWIARSSKPDLEESGSPQSDADTDYISNTISALSQEWNLLSPPRRRVTAAYTQHIFLIRKENWIKNFLAMKFTARIFWYYQWRRCSVANFIIKIVVIQLSFHTRFHLVSEKLPRVDALRASWREKEAFGELSGILFK